MLMLPFSGLLKHHMTWEEQGCGVCKEVAVCGCTVVRGQTPTLPKHTRNLSPCMGPSISAVTGEEGNAALWLLPPFQQRDSQAASRLAASREGIRTINTDSIHFPAAVTAAGWVVGGTEHLPCFQECHFSWQRIAPEEAQPQ